jgi:hypothetical protein
MRKIINIILIIVTCITLHSEVNGLITEIENKRIITVWGTHYERGYAQGYLLADDFIEVFNGYLIGEMLHGQSNTYHMLRKMFEVNFTVDEKYQQEAKGFIKGIDDSDVSLFSKNLQRNIDATDVLICNTIPDLSTAAKKHFSQDYLGGCSSLTSWGEATANTDLNGSLVITRHLDWSSSSILSSKSIMIIHNPIESDEQPWLSFGFPGMFAALSAINSSGVAVFQNMGNNNARTLDHAFKPILLTTRTAIEQKDYNNDGKNNIYDIQAALKENGSFFGAIVQAVTFASSETPVAVFEINDELGIKTRLHKDNTMIIGSNLAATNHFRKLLAGSNCFRYKNLINNLSDKPNISMESSWEIMKLSCGVPNCVYAIQFNPESGTIRWATTTNDSLAYNQVPTTFNLDELLNLK